jgi:hypothetical protein
MKTTLSVFLLVGAWSIAQAEPTLIGQWKSDANLTMSFNTAHAKLDDRKLLLSSQLVGHMTVTFSARDETMVMPDLDIKNGEGKTSRLPGTQQTNRYRLLGSTPNAIAIAKVESNNGIESITVYNFEGPDTMWVYSGGSDTVAPDSHLREYFVRIKANHAFKADVPDGTHP